MKLLRFRHGTQRGRDVLLRAAKRAANTARVARIDRRSGSLQGKRDRRLFEKLSTLPKKPRQGIYLRQSPPYLDLSALFSITPITGCTVQLVSGPYVVYIRAKWSPVPLEQELSILGKFAQEYIRLTGETIYALCVTYVQVKSSEL